MITEAGVFLRKLRLERGEKLFDMAKRLEVSSSFLSAVENGRKKFPYKWIKRLKELYQLSVFEVSNLRIAVLHSEGIGELNIRSLSVDRQACVVALAERLRVCSDRDVERIESALRKCFVNI